MRKYGRQLRNQELMHFIHHFSTIFSKSLETPVNRLFEIPGCMFASYGELGVRLYPAHDRLIILERPAIKLIPGELGEVLIGDVGVIPVVRHRVRIVPGGIEDDLRGGVREDVVHERNLIEPLEGGDEADPVFPGFGQECSEPAAVDSVLGFIGHDHERWPDRLLLAL